MPVYAILFAAFTHDQQAIGHQSVQVC